MIKWPFGGRRHPRLPIVSEPSETAPTPEDQLAAIASLSQALEAAGIEHWLFGGWGVDLWVGEITRPHEDIDVAAWRTDYDAIGTALLAAGWRHTPVPDEVVGTRYQLGRAQVEFTFFVKEVTGMVVVPRPGAPIVVSAEPLGFDRRAMGGVTARVFPLALLRAGKATPREGVADGAKDRADLEALSRVTE
jgi:hypothetical protein